MSPTRRAFVLTLPIAGGVLLAGTARADAPPLDEKDPTAASLGYVADAARADKAKFPKFAAGQACANCQFYQGKAGAPNGPCPLYAGKLVTAKGWCSAYAKKA
jgi:hypothetical protein